jgi:hypothetical protein
MAVVGPKAAVSGEWAQQQQQQQQQEPTAIVVDMTTLVKHSHPVLNPNGIPQQFGAILQLLGPLPANWVPAVTPRLRDLLHQPQRQKHPLVSSAILVSLRNTRFSLWLVDG